jgi:hypothetical protein
MTKIDCAAACVGHATSGLIRLWKLFKWECFLRKIRPVIEVKYLFRFAVVLSLLILLTVCYYSILSHAAPAHASTRNFIASPINTTAKATPNPF